MTILLNKRKLSYREVQHNALEMRRYITDLCFRNFGYKKRKELNKLPKNFDIWSAESQDKWLAKEQERIDKRNQLDNWFLIEQKHIILLIVRNIVDTIAKIECLNPILKVDFEQTRKWQNESIGNCYALLQELQYVQETIPNEANWLLYVTDIIQKEIQLLKDWKKTDYHLKRNRVFSKK